MYMRKIISRILIGCYVMAALLLVGACNDDVDIQQSYPFSIETMPVPKKLKVGETAEIRCQLHRDGRFGKQSISSAISSRTGRER